MSFVRSHRRPNRVGLAAARSIQRSLSFFLSSVFLAVEFALENKLPNQTNFYCICPPASRARFYLKSSFYCPISERLISTQKATSSCMYDETTVPCARYKMFKHHNFVVSLLVVGPYLFLNRSNHGNANTTSGTQTNIVRLFYCYNFVTISDCL